ncbi:MAG: histidine kinase [Gammaproteobacteria bacterium]|nr:histidine kinase [Gammaproteobacteria bacterium]MBU0785534.1 histidine kinase [Gammaproteobacteria bacterium]MBU0816822.1 histidine kinase [Gammaproteobacteria bacterium]MBU1786986.1 histidine kinase [Gammaproteobacteria bacterium]
MTAPFSASSSLGEILVVEQSAMVGGIIVATARELKLSRVKLATNIRAAQQLLEQQVFSGVIISLNDEAQALALLQNLRIGRYRSPSEVPVAVTATECGVELANKLGKYMVRRILLKPFKVRDVILTISKLDEGFSPN